MRGETIVAHVPGALLDPPQREENGQLKRAPATNRTIRNCLLAPQGAEEGGRFDPVTTTSWHVYAPTADFLPADSTFTIRGVPGWQLVGEIGEWRRRKVVGVEFTVKRGS